MGIIEGINYRLPKNVKPTPFYYHLRIIDIYSSRLIRTHWVIDSMCGSEGVFIAEYLLGGFLESTVEVRIAQGLASEPGSVGRV